MKVLFFNYANYLEIGIPGGIAILSALLKESGHQVRLFDTTFLKPAYYRRSQNAGPAVFKETPYTLEDRVEDDPVVDLKEEFSNILKEFQPDLLAVSAMTTNFDKTLDLLKQVQPDCLVVMGGVHATLEPEEVLRSEVVDMVCIGEGEGALVDLCNALDAGQETRNIPNLWLKRNGNLIQNTLRHFQNLDHIPVPDWSIFDQRHLFRPFEGKVYKGSFITNSRGCPERCTYCVNKVIRKTHRGCGSYFRRQSPQKTINNIKTLKEEYGATWFKFADDTFLLHTHAELETLKDGLNDLSINFGCSVQPTTINKEKVALAKKMGCVAMTVGIESGNQEIRRKILNRRISNQKLENGIRTIIDAGIRVSTFNMIGLPGETRENVFETIKFNKKLGIKAANVYIIYPFPGTEIAEIHKTNYRDADGKMISMGEAARFNLSHMSPAELEGLCKTFNLYLTLPETYWGQIKAAEGQDERSQQIFQELEVLANTFISS
ncbi:MAG: B12-binding domain-containing radical SAM protein [Desulfobacteraceae bacterium]|nr:B12-binding domain-containing radical SAM protein [Desulfobacteraceae bacterium]